MSTDEIANYIDSVEQELERQKRENQHLRNQGHVSMFSQQGDNNLIQYQLDLNEELERIDHLLRGHELRYDEKGGTYWAEPKSDKHKPFNEHGVRLLMNVISFYLNRNTILSNYDEEMINWKMKDLGDSIADLIFLKYEEMGMDSDDKKKLYQIIVQQILDTVHSAYLRALNGGERESLRTARHVSQSMPIGGQHSVLNQAHEKKFSFFKPTTWRI